MSVLTEIRLAGGLAFVFILFSLWMGELKVQGLPADYKSPVLALELVKNGNDIDQINSAEDGKARAFIRTSVLKDFGFIFIYTLFFASLSLLLSRTDLSWARLVGRLAAACVVVAAILDFVENRGMWRAIGGDVSDSLANSIRYPSLAKWALLFIFSLLVGAILISWRDIFAVPAFLFLSAGLLGISGVIMNLLRPWFYWMFPAAIISLGLAVLFLAFAFTICPEKLFKKFPAFVT